ncbi:MAG: aminotransferase class I/II-fold pyridoxal phosphate-dependent enzyme [wastewater metagenome]|nr:aminotransferase class I/II-fold pyridoxal phosphate-dependent enzyme [Candidatus Loosdrechtia aerotolerans]
MNKRIYLSPPHMGGEEIKFVQEAFESNYIAPLGPQVDAFEREFTDIVGIPHAVALASGTAAMHLALRILGVGHGDEVIAPSLTFIGGVSPVIFQGARLSFIDSDRISWNMDPDLLAEELKKREVVGKLPKVVITADIYGQCADMDKISEVCTRYDIPVVSDSAEALGATYKGRSAGAGARAVIYSFNGNKIITTSGGGMLLSEDKAIVEQARFLSQQARDAAPHYEHTQLGNNYRMSNILAAIGRGQLRVLEERVQEKRRIFQYYKNALSDIPGIEFMPEAPYGQSTRWLTVVLIDPEKFGATREYVRIALEIQNIESRPVWKPMHLQPVFKDCPMRGGSVCEYLFNRGLCLPSGSAMTTDDLDRVIQTIVDCRKKGTEVPQLAVDYGQRVSPRITQN